MGDKKSVQVGPKKYFLPEMYKKCYSQIYNFEARLDDLLLIGFPRSGTTLHSEMAWQIENGLDFETSEKVILTHRFPILDPKNPKLYHLNRSGNVSGIIGEMRQTIIKVANFLERALTEDQIEKLVDYLSIEKFKKNKSVNCEHLNDLGIASNEVTFIRSGKSGGWRKYFVGDLEREADEWIKENLKDTDLIFPED
ncbi:hypothetical protein NQ314_006173 [Rhamnusium bicolor]|uniref:Sulfotransferase domain-containing protein n=1 Tax=Rhamnusium bicolor TaxID=1586634 RepID=A0AAV8Z774_9CUCU|nr:hypothetical protein NQ314_006173 [Rhamnusium bicolor]